MPPGGLPETFLEAVDDAFERAPAPGTRAGEGRSRLGTRGAVRPRRRRRRGCARGARDARPARSRGDPARRRRARVVRPRRPAPHPSRLARRPAATGRARRAGRTRPVPSRLARDRPACDPAGGARPAPGVGAAGRASGRPRSCRAASPATSRRHSTSCARPARSSGPVPVSTAWRSTTARTLPSSGRLHAASRLTGPVHDSVRATLASSAELLARAAPARRQVSTRADVAGGALGARLERGGDERRVGAASRPKRRYGIPTTERRPRRFSRSRAAGRGRDGRTLVARRSALRAACRRAAAPGSSRARRAAPRAPGDRDPRRRSRRGDRRRVRRGLRRAEGARDGRCVPPRAISSRVSAAPSSPCPGAVERLRELRDAATRSRSCSPRPTPHSRTAASSHGRSGRPHVRPGWRARTSCCSAARRRSTSSAAAGRSFRSASLIPSGCGRRSTRSSTWVRADRGRRLAVERFDGRPVVESEALRAPRRGRVPRRAEASGPPLLSRPAADGQPLGGKGEVRPARERGSA